MIRVLRARIQQGFRTVDFPKSEPEMPDRFVGRLTVDSDRCRSDCMDCAAACPTDAISPKVGEAKTKIDFGRCLFCSECVRACPEGAVTATRDYRMAVRRREDLLSDGKTLRLAEALDARLKKLLGRSLKLRQVSAGGCNACEADVNVLNTVVFDLGRFGIQFVASPRHADGLLITGPVTKNMERALKKTFDAVPEPRIVIAVGACAISGGPYVSHPEARNGADSTVPVDLYIPGCPPHPYTILDGLLRLLALR
ncbi:MAG: NADH-quinone oxidoreductase subunit NuoB [Nitrospirae bacterium]|nr:NADH-quinone oxidoreductase subunit NuoB [Nitrospirota bacterium]